MSIKGWLLHAAHNCIVHPLLPFLPRAVGDRLHDASAYAGYGDRPEVATIIAARKSLRCGIRAAMTEAGPDEPAPEPDEVAGLRRLLDAPAEGRP